MFAGILKQALWFKLLILALASMQTTLIPTKGGVAVIWITWTCLSGLLKSLVSTCGESSASNTDRFLATINPGKELPFPLRVNIGGKTLGPMDNPAPDTTDHEIITANYIYIIYMKHLTNNLYKII